MAGRKAIANAVFALLNTAAMRAAGFKTFEKRLRLWNEVGSAEKPYLCLVRHKNNEVQGSEATPGKNTIYMSIFVYIDSSDPATIGADVLDDLLDAIDVALAPPPLQEPNQTLGGIVSHCWVEGDILLDPGDLDKQGMAIVPLKILVP